MQGFLFKNESVQISYMQYMILNLGLLLSDFEKNHCLISLNSAEVFPFENIATVLPALKKFQSSTLTLYFQVSMDNSCL